MSMKLITTAAVALCFAMPARAEKTDIVVATVNGNKITLSEIENIHSSNPQLSALPIETIYTPLLENIIDLTIISDAASKEKIQDTAEYKKQLESAKKQILASVYMDKIAEGADTKKDLEKLYNEYVKDNPPQEEMSAAHILLKTKKEAEKVIKQINKGEDFAKLANEVSENKGLQDGDLGYFTRELMVPEFSEAAFKMKEGEISKTPVKTKFGYHIIKAGPRRLTQPPKFEELEPELKRTQNAKAIEKAMTSLRKKAKVVKTPVKFKADGSVVEK